MKTNTNNRHNLTVGTGIYYTGDMANVDGFGVITAVLEGGLYVNIEMNNGRSIKMLPVALFDTGQGRRFWTAQERHEHRQAQIRRFAEEQAARGSEQAREWLAANPVAK